MSVFKVRYQTPEGRVGYSDGIEYQSSYWLVPRWNLAVVRSHKVPAWIVPMEPFEPKAIFGLDARYSLGIPVPEAVLNGPPEAARATMCEIVIAPVFVVPVEDGFWRPV